MAKTFLTVPRTDNRRRRRIGMFYENGGNGSGESGGSGSRGGRNGSVPVRESGDAQYAPRGGYSSGSGPASASGSAGSAGYEAGSFDDYYNRLISALHSYGISMSLPTLDELYSQLSAFLRPSVDAAIENRRRYGDTAMAELDADAYSRGMGGSSYLSSMKNREQDSIARDIAQLESGYTSTLAEYLFNASKELQSIQAQFAAMQLQHSYDMQKLYAQQHYQQQHSSSGGSSHSVGAQAGGGSAQTGENPYTDEEYAANYSAYMVYFECISERERYDAFHSNLGYWAEIREDMRRCLTEEAYEQLRALYDPSYSGSGHHSGRGSRPDGIGGVHTHD